MKLFLHIGTIKTGTTSIQKFLKANRDILSSHGVFIPTSIMHSYGHHRWLPFLVSNFDNKVGSQWAQSIGITDAKQKQIKISEIKNSFIHECADASVDADTCIISSEALTSLVTCDEYLRLKELLYDLFSEISIVIYIREPLKAAISVLSTHIKNGKTFRSLLSPSQERYYQLRFDYWDLVQLWKKYFPDADIIVRKFDSSSLLNGDVILDFCSQCFTKPVDINFNIPFNSNQTLSLTGMKLLRRLNLELPKLVSKHRNKIVRLVAKNTNDGTLFIPSLNESSRFDELFRISLEKLKASYFRDDQILFSRITNFSNSSIDLSEFELKEHISYKLIEDLLHEL